MVNSVSSIKHNGQWFGAKHFTVLATLGNECTAIHFNSLFIYVLTQEPKGQL
jgi:hypothetical protein